MPELDPNLNLVYDKPKTNYLMPKHLRENQLSPEQASSLLSGMRAVAPHGALDKTRMDWNGLQIGGYGSRVNDNDRITNIGRWLHHFDGDEFEGSHPDKTQGFGDAFLPFANLVTVPSGMPGPAMHELGHAIDFNGFPANSKLRHLGAALYRNYAPVLWKEHAAWKKGRKHLLEAHSTGKLDSDTTLKTLESAKGSKRVGLGSYWGAGLGTLGGAAAGVGSLLALHEAGIDLDRGAGRLAALPIILGASLGTIGGTSIGHQMAKTPPNREKLIHMMAKHMERKTGMTYDAARKQIEKQLTLTNARQSQAPAQRKAAAAEFGAKAAASAAHIGRFALDGAMTGGLAGGALGGIGGLAHGAYSAGKGKRLAGALKGGLRGAAGGALVGGGLLGGLGAGFAAGAPNEALLSRDKATQQAALQNMETNWKKDPAQLPTDAANILGFSLGGAAVGGVAGSQLRNMLPGGKSKKDAPKKEPETNEGEKMSHAFEFGVKVAFATAGKTAAGPLDLSAASSKIKQVGAQAHKALFNSPAPSPTAGVFGVKPGAPATPSGDQQDHTRQMRQLSYGADTNYQGRHPDALLRPVGEEPKTTIEGRNPISALAGNSESPQTAGYNAARMAQPASARDGASFVGTMNQRRELQKIFGAQNAANVQARQTQGEEPVAPGTPKYPTGGTGAPQIRYQPAAMEYHFPRGQVGINRPESPRMYGYDR